MTSVSYRIILNHLTQMAKQNIHISILVAIIFCCFGISVPSPRPPQEDSDSGEAGNFAYKLVVKLNPVDILSQIFDLAEENNINISEILNSRLFNSPLFNQDFLKLDFFFSDLLNSEIISINNFRKLSKAIFGMGGNDSKGSFNPRVVEIVQEFFERKDREGLKNFLNSLPGP